MVYPSRNTAHMDLLIQKRGKHFFFSISGTESFIKWIKRLIKLSFVSENMLGKRVKHKAQPPVQQCVWGVRLKLSSAVYFMLSLLKRDRSRLLMFFQLQKPKIFLASLYNKLLQMIKVLRIPHARSKIDVLNNVPDISFSTLYTKRPHKYQYNPTQIALFGNSSPRAA